MGKPCFWQECQGRDFNLGRLVDHRHRLHGQSHPLSLQRCTGPTPVPSMVLTPPLTRAPSTIPPHTSHQSSTILPCTPHQPSTHPHHPSVHPHQPSTHPHPPSTHPVSTLHMAPTIPLQAPADVDASLPWRTVLYVPHCVSLCSHGKAFRLSAPRSPNTARWGLQWAPFLRALKWN